MTVVRRDQKTIATRNAHLVRSEEVHGKGAVETTMKTKQYQPAHLCCSPGKGGCVDSGRKNREISAVMETAAARATGLLSEGAISLAGTSSPRRAARCGGPQSMGSIPLQS